MTTNRSSPAPGVATAPMAVPGATLAERAEPYITAEDGDGLPRTILEAVADRMCDDWAVPMMFSPFCESYLTEIRLAQRACEAEGGRDGGIYGG